MTLADELRGITPRITLQGKRVIHEDPADAIYRPELPRAHAITEWAKTAGPFTAHDVADAIGIERKHASHYISVMNRAGLLKRMGFEKNTGGRARIVWEMKPEPDTPVDKANRKHFGA